MRQILLVLRDRYHPQRTAVITMLATVIGPIGLVLLGYTVYLAIVGNLFAVAILVIAAVIAGFVVYRIMHKRIPYIHVRQWFYGRRHKMIGY